MPDATLRAITVEGFRGIGPKAALAADFALEGERGACTVACEWPEGAELEAATRRHRPFLSYNELGSLLDEGPSELYDALAKVLGLDALVDAQTALQQARSARDKAVKDADQERKTILARLDDVSGERAGRVKEALGRKDWGLDEVEAVLAGSPTSGEKDGATDLLKRLAVLQPPDPNAVAEAVKALRDADQRQTAAAQSVAGKSDQLATLLDHALSFHKVHGDGACPVYRNPNALDNAWHQQKAQEAEALRQAAREATEARKAVAEAQAAVQRLMAIDWDPVRRAGEVGLGDLAEKARRCHSEGAKAPEESAIATSVSVEQLRQRAVESLRSREDTWRPQALTLLEWLPKAVGARRSAVTLPLLKHADKWLKEAADAIRNERFAPIADQTKTIWDQLNLQSNVALDAVHLGGTGKARKVELNVTVDGHEGVALGMTSQGDSSSLQGKPS